MEGLFDLFSCLTADRWIRLSGAREIFGELGFAPRRSQIVQGSIGRDPARPTLEIALRVEPRSGPVNAPEGFYGQILRNPGVANDADNPGKNFVLALSKERFERFQVARREPFQQSHLPLSVTTYWSFLSRVTLIFKIQFLPSTW